MLTWKTKDRIYPLLSTKKYSFQLRYIPNGKIVFEDGFVDINIRWKEKDNFFSFLDRLRDLLKVMLMGDDLTEKQVKRVLERIDEVKMLGWFVRVDSKSELRKKRNKYEERLYQYFEKQKVT